MAADSAPDSAEYHEYEDSYAEQDDGRDGGVEEKYQWVYEADDDDYEFDEFESAVQVTAVAALPEPIVKEKSDLPDHVYWDDFAFTKCWDAALLDFKYQHPAQFEPLMDAPRSLVQKHEAAPLWYGPYVAPNPARARSDGRPTPSPAPTLPPKAKRKSKASSSSSQKKAKLSIQSSPVSMGIQESIAVPVSTPTSPRWTPQSPTFQRHVSPDHLPSASTSTLPLPNPNISTPLPIADPHLPSPSELKRLPLPIPHQVDPNSLPISYPKPPPIVPIEVGEEGEASETSEEMLNSALWAWYSAGYRTALYHAKLSLVPGVGPTNN